MAHPNAVATARYLNFGIVCDANLLPVKNHRGTSYRWFNDQHHLCDGLRTGKLYSVAYQLRHARAHACFHDVRV